MSKSKVIWKNEEGHIIYCDDGKDYDVTKILAVHDQLVEALKERVPVACRRMCLTDPTGKEEGCHTEECDKARAALKAAGEEV